MTEPLYVGIDVSKRYLDIAFEPARAPQRVAQAEEGIRALVTQLQALGPALVVL